MKRFIPLFLSAMTIMTFHACHRAGDAGGNPFFEAEWDTPYGAPPFDRIATEHFKPAFERGMSLHDEEIAAIVSSKAEPDFENTVLAFDESGRMLSRVSAVFELLDAADTDEGMQAVAAEMMPALSAHRDAVMMNDELFAKIKSVYDRRAAMDLDAEQLRLTEKIYDRFVRAGALLAADKKERLKEINERLSRLGVAFGRNLLAETNAFAMELSVEELKGIPSVVRDPALEQGKASGREGKYVFTLQKPSMLPLLTYCENRALRDSIYNAYVSRGDRGNEHDNKAVVAEMAALRYEKAALLGYRSYADYVASNQMAGSPEAVYALLDRVWTPALERANGELERMLPMLRRDEGADAVFEPWDWWYYAEKVRKEDYDLQEEGVRQYLTLDNVKGGIFFLANRLYGITFRPLAAPVYNDECEVYEVIDADETPLGALYFDFHPRAGKRGGAWCGHFTEQTYRDGRRVGPVVSVVCNFTRPSGRIPALLSIDEAETLFHEFGHALHGLFADVRYRGLADVEGDFVELPSQIMENWAFTPEMLRQYAVNYRTGEVMSDEMIDKIRRSSLFNKGFATTELVAAALSDMDIHSLASADPIDVDAFEREALSVKRGLMPQIAPRYRYPYFSHIFDGGYSAGYCFYIWAEVLDKDAFRAFVESGDLFDRGTAERFRREVLARGGSRAGMDMYRAFRGADPDADAMLIGRGLVDAPEPTAETEAREVGTVDTRAIARERAERSRREREAARAEADSTAGEE